MNRRIVAEKLGLRRLRGGARSQSCRFLLVLALLCQSGCAASPFGYPHFWDLPKGKPNESDLLGTYVVLRPVGRVPSITGYKIGDTKIVLKPDHSVSLIEVPEHETFGDIQRCSFTGLGTWNVYESVANDGDWWLEVNLQNSKKESQQYNGGHSFILLGRKAPYRLYLTIGDPDDDKGIEFHKTD